AGFSHLLEGATQCGAGRFLTASLELNRGWELNPSLDRLTRANGQSPGQNLSAGEKFALGGPSGVRAYTLGEGSGDLGAALSAELRYSMPTCVGEELRMSGFVDAGSIQLYHDPPATIPTETGRNTYPPAGVGVGAV